MLKRDNSSQVFLDCSILFPSQKGIYPIPLRVRGYRVVSQGKIDTLSRKMECQSKLVENPEGGGGVGERDKVKVETIRYRRDKCVFSPFSPFLLFSTHTD